MFLLILILFISIIFPSDSNLEWIDSIIIHGNKRTKDYIIEREILHPINSVLDSSILLDDTNRLYNLNLFSKVKISQNNNNYNIEVVESFSIIPIPLIDYDDTKKEFSIGMAIADINFLGRNQNLALGGTFIGDKSYIVNLSNPWIFGNHISLQLFFQNINSYNIFYNFSFNKTFNFIKTGFYLKEYHKFDFLLGYIRYQISEFEIIESDISNNINDNFYERYNYNIFQINYKFDKRDIYIDPTKGHVFNFHSTFHKDLNERGNILELNFIFKKYYSVTIPFLIEPVFSYAIKNVFKYYPSNELSVFRYEYLGGEDFVRGYSSLPNKAPNNEIENLIEGSNIVYNSFELQSTIFERKDYNRLEFGIDGVLFVDLGTASWDYNKIKIDNMIIGYGFGFKFFMGSALDNVSLMFGFNPYGQFHYHLSDS